MRGAVTTFAMQEALADRGFDPGPVDGIRGRRTIGALKAFQVAMGMPPTGLVDAATARALLGAAFADAALPDAMPWMDQARRMKGMHESLHNEDLKTFLASDGGTVGDPALQPWCADFVQTCVALTLPDEALPTNPYASISWTRFGAPIAPCPGAVICLWREDPESWKGHVGFCVEATNSDILILGGNQSDSISEKWVSRSFLRMDGSRWPVTALAPSPTVTTAGSPV
ncbi:Putative peptidoglycan binding domain protein [Rhodobacteraceae bacterium THAF1]|uniref:NlpC/P60 family protein n=1 Tax=Palleronia sp. THAF1 TaxID=2587842 RepID=UPI000F3E05C6|nr:peptidoglycan-binding protein [Palleronia sp. THAF1]QFU10379.1 Putative peptidoglycan binding domain protein [Palleronia sp. THAF1]VDC31411.1 Putative peptidoglycan binding domain protein [Rhodobacteraceae bacterium THAF1]